MKVTKTTEKYLFYQDGNDYILNFGTIKKGEDTTTELLFEEVDNPKSTAISPKCGCTLVDKNIISDNSFSIKVKYTQCETTFTKIVTVNDGKSNSFKIKLSGKCQ